MWCATQPVEPAHCIAIVRQAPSGADPEYTVRKGDTLYLIAVHFYKKGAAWPVIWHANLSEVPDPSALGIGKHLRIPSSSFVPAWLARQALGAAQPAPTPATSQIPVANTPTYSGGGIWNCIEQHEGAWNANTGNGFSGGLQFTEGTWDAYGGQQFAPYAYEASPADQIIVGERVVNGWTNPQGKFIPPQGWGAWPNSSVACGVGSGGGGGGSAAVFSATALVDESTALFVADYHHHHHRPFSSPCWNREKRKRPGWCKRLAALHWAEKQLGCPYQWAGTGPCAQGFDCSGLVMESYIHTGIDLPRTTYEMQSSSMLRMMDDPRPGYIILYGPPGGAYHAALVVNAHEQIAAPDQGSDIQFQPIDWSAGPVFYEVVT